jgi:hypothetical protein
MIDQKASTPASAAHRAPFSGSSDPSLALRMYRCIDDKQRALEWLEKAYQEHNPDLIELTREPSFESLRSDAKFRELVERIGWSA